MAPDPVDRFLSTLRSHELMLVRALDQGAYARSYFGELSPEQREKALELASADGLIADHVTDDSGAVLTPEQFEARFLCE